MAIVNLTYCNALTGNNVTVQYNDVTHAIVGSTVNFTGCSSDPRPAGYELYNHVDGAETWSVRAQNYPNYAFVVRIAGGSGGGVIPIVCQLAFFLEGCFATNASEPGIADGGIVVSSLDPSGLTPVRYKIGSDFTYPAGGQVSGIFTNLVPGTYTIYARNSSTCRATIDITVLADRTYGVRYRLDFHDLLSSGANRKYRLDIEDSEYFGAVTEVKGYGINPVRVSHRGESSEDIFTDNVVASQILVDLDSETDQQFIDFYTFDERRFRAKLYLHNGSSYDLFHQGYLTPMLYSEPYILKENYPVNLVFTDGLADLKDYKFTDDGDNYPVSRIPIFSALNFILNKTDVRLNIWENVNLYPTGFLSGTNDSTLEQAYIDPIRYRNDDGTYKTCREVLGYLMDFLGARIYQSNGRWNIDLISEKSASAVATRKRTNLYAVIAGGNESPRVLLRRSVAASPRVIFKDQSAVMNIPQTYGTIKLTYDLGIEKENNLLPYGNFEAEDVENGQLKGWQVEDLTIGGDGTFGLEKLIEPRGNSRFALFFDFTACDIGENIFKLAAAPVQYNYPYNLITNPSGSQFQSIRVSFDVFTRPLFTNAEIYLDYKVILNGGLYVQPRLYSTTNRRNISDNVDNLIDGEYNRVYITESLTWKTISFEFPIYFTSLNGFSSDGPIELELRVNSNPIYDYVDFAALRAELVDQLTTADTVYFNKKRKVLEVVDGNDIIHFYELERSSAAESVPDVIRPTTFSTAAPYRRAYVWKLKQSVEITSTDKNWLQNMLIDNVSMEYLPDYEPPVETIEVTEVPNESVKQTLEKTLYHGDLQTPLDDNYKYISSAYLSAADGTPITGGWQRRGVTENFTITQLLGKMIRGQYQDIRWKLSGLLQCPDDMPTFWNTLHEVRTGKVYQFMSLTQMLRTQEAEFEAIETLAGGDPLDESTDPGGTIGPIEPPVVTRVHSLDFSTDFN
jgi:hypothetical protein